MQQTRAILVNEERQETRLLTVLEAARRLGISPKTVRRLEKSGKLPSRRFGRVLRFHPVEIMEAGRT